MVQGGKTSCDVLGNTYWRFLWKYHFYFCLNDPVITPDWIQGTPVTSNGAVYRWGNWHSDGLSNLSKAREDKGLSIWDLTSDLSGYKSMLFHNAIHSIEHST